MMAAKADLGTARCCTNGKCDESLRQLFYSPHTSWRLCRWKSVSGCNQLRIVSKCQAFIEALIVYSKRFVFGTAVHAAAFQRKIFWQRLVRLRSQPRQTFLTQYLCVLSLPTFLKEWKNFLRLV
ncbi:hypothetical protein DPMN_144779 [Dreissena polymorpha]|uniref:Uncharacterized protein n=1 Tax=Dreissena polymorpha TaxID=45954 RepID=A0A9D4F4P3_DREPO|nr:hypothetical protein DPMN_144779 [Dreissena polymorpha]